MDCTSASSNDCRCRLARTIARTALLALIALSTAGARSAWALADDASIKGTVFDPLGARVSGATVKLVRDGQEAAATAADSAGEFTFQTIAEGRYQIEVTAAGFERRVTDPFFVGGSGTVSIDVPLRIGPLEQQVVVTAAAEEVPQSQVGAAVTVIDQDTLDALGKTDVLEALRLVPGVSVVQTGASGGITSLFIRGGSSDFNKVLIDGIPANDIGGAFDFSNLATTGVDRVEVLRGSNSVLYGSDAMAGVVSLTTPRGLTRLPELSYSLDGGNLSTIHQALSIGGVIKRFDYFSEYSHFATDNSVPNNMFSNDTFAGRFGLAVGNATYLSGTVRQIDTRYGSPNATDYYGISDDSWQTNKDTYVGVSAQSQISDHWQSTIRLASADEHYHVVNPSPTGQLDAFGDYLGDPVTIHGANGDVTSGQAILDYGGTYPSIYDATTSRRSLVGQTSYHVGPELDLTAGVRVEHEAGSTPSGSGSAVERNNAGSFVEARGTVLRHTYVTGGLGYDHNAIFGSAVTPRLSVASYLRDPSPTSKFGDTKITFNAGKGIKEPSVSQQLSSLFTLLQSSPQGSSLIASSGIAPIGAERTRSVDVGVEQGLWQGRARVRAAYFDNGFTDLIEFVGSSELPQFGVPPSVAAATPAGAYVNSQSSRARGLETSAEVRIGHKIRVSGSYTYLDAIVTQTLASPPVFNPAYPTIPIGAYAPLVGAQPFRRPPHSGSLMASVIQGPVIVSVAGYFAGKSDDSTFLVDQFYGNSLLLPNHDLDAGYQKVDVSGSYRFHPRLRWYATIQNILNEHYEAAAGYPALPRTARTGITVTLGGDGPKTP